MELLGDIYQGAPLHSPRFAKPLRLKGKMNYLEIHISKTTYHYYYYYDSVDQDN